MIERLGSSSRLIEQALGVFHREFELQVSLESFSLHNMAMLRTDLSSFLSLEKERERGADIFSITDRDGLVGLSQVRYYKWELLRPQIFIASYKDSSGETIFSLQNLGDIIDSTFKDTQRMNFAFELIYLWVRSDLRGKKLGDALFRYSFNYIQNRCKLRSLYFTICRSVPGETGKGRQVFDLLAKKEREKAGIDDTSQFKFSGLSVPAKSLSATLDENLDPVEPLPKSKALQLLATRWGMMPICLSKKLNLVYAQIK